MGRVRSQSCARKHGTNPPKNYLHTGCFFLLTPWDPDHEIAEIIQYFLVREVSAMSCICFWKQAVPEFRSRVLRVIVESFLGHQKVFDMGDMPSSFRPHMVGSYAYPRYSNFEFMRAVRFLVLDG